MRPCEDAGEREDAMTELPVADECAWCVTNAHPRLGDCICCHGELVASALRACARARGATYLGQHVTGQTPCAGRLPSASLLRAPLLPVPDGDGGCEGEQRDLGRASNPQYF